MKSISQLAVLSCQSPALCRAGCGAVAAMGRAYCLRCEEEIDAMNAWYCKQEARELHGLLRRQERREHFRRAMRRGRVALDVVNVIVVLGGLAYLGLVYGAVLLQWLGWL